MTQYRRIARRRIARRQTAGFTLMEVCLALIVFGMMTVLFGAVFPMTVRGAQYSGNYTQAAMIAQHKMEQLRSAGFSSLDQTHLTNLNAIDSPQASGYPAPVSGGTSYSFTSAEHLVSDGVTKGYFAPGSMGTVTVADYAALHPSSGVPSGTLALVTVSVTWAGGGVSNSSYSTSALLANAAP